MPIKSQLDSMSSLEWRNLCENEVYKARFPDKHLISKPFSKPIYARYRSIPRNRSSGFSTLKKLKRVVLTFFHGAMSFDTMWDEISHESEPRVYIVSWNDHFFVLKVDFDAYYIIDTLEERLFEGCDQAYILKFDRNTIIYQIHATESGLAILTESQLPKPLNRWSRTRVKTRLLARVKNLIGVHFDKRTASGYEKGLPFSTPILHRLQIEFHYTQLQQLPPIPVIAPAVDDSAIPVAT
ncbi:hypothetical protein Hanom_Chr12g01180911 [Helianthus anomalus]